MANRSQPLSNPPGSSGVPMTALWLVIVCGCLISLLSFGPRSVLGLFLVPMTEAQGWSREVFALSLAIQNLIWGIGQPFAGAVADRYGTGRVLALGGLIYAGGLVLMAWAPTPAWLHVSAGLMIGLGMAAASFSIVLAAFGRRVPPEKRPMVFGIGTAAGSMGQFLFAPMGRAFIADYGWEQALILLGVIMLAIPVLAFALRGRSDQSAAADFIKDQTLTQAVTQAFAHRSYVLLVIGFFVCGFHVAFITAHLPAYLEDLGMDPTLGAWSLALIGLFNVIGSLASGVIAGKYSKPIFLALIYLARAAIIALFLILPISPLTVLVFSATMGLLWLSTVPPTSALVAIMFGPKYMATLMGIVFFNHQLGAFLGVWLGGRLYDTTGSYDVVWYLGIALGILAAIVHWPIREARADTPLATPAE
ncbi:MAG: MFS transporter [Rhizobiales bacterium]|nr:MFS transporter [Hyphomicrobiales bacterium]MBO6700416.1 MFS transporter [Hyphomicrobiales bacterium]MBO6737952.1 MFS transporter [Hyphomicrobiales bacterium]MBO6913741.1 MFS transporter [Hyphomicrobiales bacterium]MBO6954364.1 MFS transporter [Hyphomicrobiales bacterium]